MMEESKKEAARRARKRSHPWAFPIGFLILLFAVIGVVTAARSGVNQVKKWTSQDAQKSAYEQLIETVVMFNPDPFDDVKSADLNQLLEISIWSLLKDNQDPYQYQDEEGYMVVPAKEVDQQFKKLFGDELKLTHQTLANDGYSFEYDTASQSYRIPPTGIETAYIPNVTKMDKKGDSVILTVGYISGNNLEQDAKGNIVETTPDKYMIFTIRKKGDLQYISAIQNQSADITAATKKNEKTSAAATGSPTTEASSPATSAPETRNDQ